MILLKTFSKTPFILGLVISFLGSLPLGYLNIIALQLLIENSIYSVLSFILGIVCIEFVVLQLVSIMANWLVKQQKILLFIDVFTILFLMSLSIYFLTKIGQNKPLHMADIALGTTPLLLGLLLNALNVIQWPYWSGVYIYLLRSNQMAAKRWTTNLFITGALLGTVMGILFFVYVAKFFLHQSNIDLSTYLNPIFGILFLILTLIHSVKLLKKQGNPT